MKLGFQRELGQDRESKPVGLVEAESSSPDEPLKMVVIGDRVVVGGLGC